MGYGVLCIALTFVAAELGGVLQVNIHFSLHLLLVVHRHRFQAYLLRLDLKQIYI